MASKKFSPKKFETEIVLPTIEDIQKLMAVKGGEYSGTLDRLANFRRTAEEAGVTKEQALLTFARKHWDAIATYVRDQATGTRRQRSEKMEGRVDDLIVYLLLFKAMLAEGPDSDE